MAGDKYDIYPDEAWSKPVVIEHGKGATFEMLKGDHIKIISEKGGQIASLTFKNYNQALTRDINGFSINNFPQQTAVLKEGMYLYDGSGKKYLRLIKNTSEAPVDLLFPGCFSALYNHHINGCREILSEQLHIPLESLPAVVSIFMYVDDFTITVRKSPAAGDYVIFRAIENVEVGISACPDRHFCNPRPGNILVQLLRAPKNS